MKVIQKIPRVPEGLPIDRLVHGRLYTVVGGTVVYLATNHPIFRLVEVVNGYIYGPDLSAEIRYVEVENATLHIG